VAERRAFLHRLPVAERRFVAEALRDETVGGALLLASTVVALLWATFATDSYDTVRDTVIGPHALHLDLTLEEWAADAALAVFFFVAGLELKRELVVGDLRNLAEAVLPVVAAVAGMVVPAVAYLLVTFGAEGAARGWAVPTATDIAFALAVLAVIGSALPTALRAFLLTLAVVDDLGAILIIAIFFTEDLELVPLIGAVVLLAGYELLQRRRVRAWWVYVPLAAAVWTLVHASGVHATVAGVALGLLTRVHLDPGERESPAERLEHRLRPVSAGVAVPFFALMSAGLPLGDKSFIDSFGDVAAIGVLIGLVVGKTVGVFGGTYLTARFTRAELNPALGWLDVLGVAMLAGIGFTVSLLINELAFEADPERIEHVKAAILVGSVLAAVLASALLRVRNGKYRAMIASEDREDEQMSGRQSTGQTDRD
jgi:NhaA family Na+:H+ antiporter